MSSSSPYSSRPKSSHHINSLDGLRGLAFLAVFFFHYGISSHANSPWVHVATWISEGGWIGVDLFFVLSGFLITGILLDTREDTYYFRNFYARRSLRIFPLFYAVLFGLLLLTPVLHLRWHPGHIAYFFYLGNIAGHVQPGLNNIQPAVSFAHTWSLAVEEQFYLIWPLVVFRVRSQRTLVQVCLVAMVASCILRLVLLRISPVSGIEWSYGELPTHCDGLLWGAIVALLSRPGPLFMPLAAMVRHSRMLLAGAVLGLAIIAWHNGNLNYHNHWTAIVGFPLLAILCTCILVRTIQPGSLFSKLGHSRLLRFFGRYSYGMYIYHILFWPLVGKLLPVLQARLHSQALGGLAFVLLALAGTSVVSVLSFELYERQWLKLKSRFDYRKPPSSAVAV